MRSGYELDNKVINIRETRYKEYGTWNQNVHIKLHPALYSIIAFLGGVKTMADRGKGDRVAGVVPYDDNYKCRVTL